MDLGVDDVRPAVVAIDLHRGHLDPAVATMPVVPGSEARIIAANRRFLARCRAVGVPVVHLVTSYRDREEIRSNPFWRTRADDPTDSRTQAERHNLAGSPGCQVIAELLEPERDVIVDRKKRYDCFTATDLDFTLRAHGVNTVLLTGVNTNSCILATASSACSRDYAVIVIEDCVDTMNGPELHAAALACVRNAFGWVMSGDEALEHVTPADGHRGEVASFHLMTGSRS